MQRAFAQLTISVASKATHLIEPHQHQHRSPTRTHITIFDLLAEVLQGDQVRQYTDRAVYVIQHGQAKEEVPLRHRMFSANHAWRRVHHGSPTFRPALAVFMCNRDLKTFPATICVSAQAQFMA